MKRLLLSFALITAFSAAGSLPAEDLTQLAGKWSVKKLNEQGQPYTQTIEVKQNKFVFQIIGGDDQVVVHAEGELKLEALGPFKSARFLHIRAGGSAANLDDVDDEYASVYALDDDTWTMASNFDKQRERKPSLDVYRRVKAAEARTLVIDEIEMADTPQSATWYFCFEAKAEGISRRFYVENKGYDKNQATIPVALQFPGLRVGQKCAFTMKLDDVDGDVCTEDVDNRSAGEFTVSERGSQSYKPEEHWRYTVRWHLQP